jgi:hypothetical protein
MSADRAVMLNEIRYAERLCQRTARLYRHVQTAGTWLTIVGGSGALTAMSKALPDWVAIGGAIMFTVAGAMLVAMRPADKAAQNEVDLKRYAALRVKAANLDDKALRAAIDDARPSDAPEFEALREVAYNDVVEEVGQPTYKVPLKRHQRWLAAIA